MLCSTTLLLPSPVGHHYYSSCYLLAFGLMLLLLLHAGYRRGYPLQTWLVLLAASTLAFIVGTKLITLPTGAWPALLHGIWPDSTARSVLGGGLGFVGALLVLRRWLGYSWHIVDAFAGPLCAGLVVQCIGCLLTGCCFGAPTDGNWGLTYAAGTLPYQLQLQQGLLDTHAAHSLAVHPTQLYTLLLCAGVWLVLHLTRHRQWPAGSRALLQAGLLVVGRLLIEFWRDPAGEPVGSSVVALGRLQMLQLQWLLLPCAVLLLGSWLWLIRYATPTPDEAPENRPVRNLLGALGLLAFAALLPAGALTLPELLVVKAVLLAVVVLATATILRGALAAQRTGLPLAALAAVLLFTNQVPADTTGNKQHWSVTVGGGNGEFAREQQPYENEGCGSPPPTQPFRHKYQSVSVDVSSTWKPDERPEAENEAGLRLMVGRDQQHTIGRPDTVKSTFLFAINPHYMLNRRWFGIGGGLLLGTLGYSKTAGDTYQPLVAAPHFTTWIGRREYLYVQGDVNTPNQGLGNPALRVAVGSRFRSSGRYSVLLGMSTGSGYPTPPDVNDKAFFVESSLQISPRWQVQPYLTLGGREFRQAHVQLRYVLPPHNR
ncbi:prolipoprotein diacylglyceryl transferase [Microvirga sp. STR05]|uniref:Prolipoprotein diacylglyceryl transferase n=1 Tax=Hymenobacter duratus TaxID=2771356 RepID=A0ABR8JEJ4_9BACT|nr:prolipoprotein diacylglyceryl transferase family protein [Hymenobacter duratus]MBD2715279.1 prolipoprotein diacylglyceryl transferase [Hymenobacter duratus]MBR7950186.1 prolipoprotein diacylglyceryl transferase [Microvirga sp. STR05]